MAKETKTASPSFDDYAEENLLINEEEKPKTEETEEEDPDKEEKPKKEEPKKKDKKVASKKEEKQEEPKEEEEEEPKDKVKEEEEEDQDSDPETAQKFFDEVQKITGLEVEVDYADVDPLSPQGVALREAAVKDLVLDNFLGELEEKFPVVFKALKHANNGGDPSELFTQTKSRDYSRVDLKEGDEALAKQILTEYYQGKGVKSEEKIKKLLEVAEDSKDGLVGDAKSALEELKKEQEEEKDELLEEQERSAQEQKKKDQILVAAVDEVLDNKQLGSFKITDRNEGVDFRKFVLENIRRTSDGKYEIATPLDEKNIERQLQYQYFQFKKGDLSKIIQQKVGTEKAKDLKLRLASEQKKKTTTTPEDTTRKSLSLQDY